MAITPATRAQIRDRSILEAKRLLVLFIYLALLLGSFGIYRHLVLWEYRIHYLHYGYALIEALVLAKVIMIGEALHLGERYRDRPLIVPTLYKTFLFSLLFLVFIALEDLVTGWIHRQSLGEIIHHVLSESIDEKLARALVTFVALIPLFAYREVGRVLGEGKLFELFAKPRPTPSGTGGSG